MTRPNMTVLFLLFTCLATTNAKLGISRQMNLRSAGEDESQPLRQLTEIQPLGGEPPAEMYPLQECQGDCDSDADCDTFLVCFQHEPGMSVPGCTGGEDDPSRTDYCILEELAPPAGFPVAAPSISTGVAPVVAPSKLGLPEVQMVGNNQNPPEAYPLGLCEGDCDSDDDCEGILVCFQRDGGEAVPSCIGGPGVTSRGDFCVHPGDLTPSAGPGPTTPISDAATEPTTVPSAVLTELLSESPTVATTMGPTSGPTSSPTTMAPTSGPTSSSPTMSPSKGQTASPTLFVVPSSSPSANPTPAVPDVDVVGNNGFPIDDYPLGLCKGDCDIDDDCFGDLICFQRAAFDPVPHCAGGESFGGGADFCTYADPVEGAELTSAPTSDPTAGPEPTNEPTESSSSLPTMLPTQTRITSSPTSPSIPWGAKEVIKVGANGNPPEAFPLGQCEGDCDIDDDCADGLICFQRDGGVAVPGCFGGEDDNSRNDYCILVTNAPTASPTDMPTTLSPSDSPTVATDPPSPSPTVVVTAAPTTATPTTVAPTTAAPVSGDRSDNAPVLSVGIVPVTTDQPSWEPSSYVVPSVSPSNRTPPPIPTIKNVRLKLYWEDGYTWQEKTVESWWCMMYNFNGYPGTGRCWYGDYIEPCNQDEVYIARCNDDERQRFDFIFLENGLQVLLKPHEGDRCFQRVETSIVLMPCDISLKSQRWYAPNGEFDYGAKFEISQRTFRSHCVTQDHHPKPGEVVELHPCNVARSEGHQTSYWNIY